MLFRDLCSCSDDAVLAVAGVTATTVGLEDDKEVSGGSRVADVAGKLSWRTLAAGDVESPLEDFTCVFDDNGPLLLTA